jgi:hypothetical protein
VSKKSKKYRGVKGIEVDIESRNITINGSSYDKNGVSTVQNEENHRGGVHSGTFQYHWPAYRDDE